MNRVAGIHRIALQVGNLDQVSRFYRDLWGMELVRADAQEHQFRSHGVAEPDLVFHAGPKAGLEYLALAVRSAADLDAILARVEKAGHKGLIAERSDREATLRDPDGNLVKLVVAPKAGLVREVAEPAQGPRKIGHIVLWTPQREVMEKFYALLGLGVSDRTARGMSFMRCNTDHHSVAFVDSKGKTGLQHIAFDVGTLDGVMHQKARLEAGGVPCVWGLGRHGPGNNLFTYYLDPAKTCIEFYGELEQIPDGEIPPEPRYWGPEHKGDQWGLAGPPPAAFTGEAH
nr:K172 [uncultured bacterium]